MYGSNQIVWNSKHQKPEVHHDLKLGPDTYLSEYFGSCFPKYVQLHFVKVGDDKEEPFCPNTIEQASQLLMEGKIKPADMPKSHNECCGGWKSNGHAFWCESSTDRKDKRDVIEHHETEKLQAYWNKCVNRARRAYAVQLHRNAKKYIDLVQNLAPKEYGYEPTVEDLQFCGTLHDLLTTIPQIDKIEKWDCDYDDDEKEETE